MILSGTLSVKGHKGKYMMKAERALGLGASKTRWEKLPACESKLLLLSECITCEAGTRELALGRQRPCLIFLEVSFFSWGVGVDIVLSLSQSPLGS